MDTKANKTAKIPISLRMVDGLDKLGLVQRKAPETSLQEGVAREGLRSYKPFPEQQGGEPPEGLYVISVAARLLAMHPQTLRKYERAGFVSPSRTIGMLRLYSVEDIVRLRLIKHMVEDLGLNLAGVNLTLSLVDGLLTMRRHLDALGEQDVGSLLNERLAEILDLLHNDA